MIMVGVVYRALQSLVAFARGFFFGSLASAPLPPVAAESRSDDSPFYWIESESDDETSESTTSTSPPPAPAELATGSVTVASGPVASGGVTSGKVGPVTGAATTVTVTPAAGTTRTASEMTSGINDPPHGHGRRVRPRRDSESSEDEGAIVWSTIRNQSDMDTFWSKSKK